jgi:hypothetical protein
MVHGSSCNQPAAAHDGSIAIALPVEGITIDGDLSDWPEELPSYPISLLSDGDRGVARADVRIQSVKSETLWFLVETDHEGRFTMELPVGKYGLMVTQPGGAETTEVVAECSSTS